MVEKAMNSKGFTLIEMAMVILIVGFLSIPLFQMYDTYQYDKRTRITIQNLADIRNELGIYAIKYGHYPKPADAGAPVGDVTFGREFGGDDPLNPGDWDTIGLGGCAGTNGGLCRYNGQRDVDNDTVNEAILLGSVPIVTLSDLNGSPRRIPHDMGLDGWGNRLMYAVSQAQSGPDQMDDMAGVISIASEIPKASGALNHVGGTEDDAHYALIAPGKDGIGAFSRNGAPLESCAGGVYGEPGGPPPDVDHPAGSFVTLDYMNCDPNGVFIAALDNAEAEGARHYDDRITFGKSAKSALWSYVMEGPVGNQIVTRNIQNLNEGNIGLGKVPERRLDIEGNLRAETRVRTPEICDNAGNCFDVSALSASHTTPSLANEGNKDLSPGIKCAAGRAMVGISNSDEDCESFALPNTWTPQTCGPGRWLRGVRNDGIIECTN